MELNTSINGSTPMFAIMSRETHGRNERKRDGAAFSAKYNAWWNDIPYIYMHTHVRAVKWAREKRIRQAQTM